MYQVRKAKRSSINESQGNTSALRSLHYYGFGAHKLSDVMGKRFTDVKPCDIIAGSPKGRYIAIEGKIIKKWCGFNSKVLRPQQRAELDRATFKTEGRAFIFLYVRIEKIHFLVVFDWKKYRSILDKGIHIDHMKKKMFGVWLPPKKDKKGKVIYNIKNLLSKRFK